MLMWEDKYLFSSLIQCEKNKWLYKINFWKSKKPELNNKEITEKEITEKEINKIKKLEKFLLESTSESSLNSIWENFEKIKTFENFKDLEEEIKRIIKNKNFSFEKMLDLSKFSIATKESILEEILKLYNFLLHFIEYKDLLKLIANVSLTSDEQKEGVDFISLKKYGTLNLLLIKDWWLNQEKINDQYEKGFISSVDRVTRFINVFMQAVIVFLCLKNSGVETKLLNIKENKLDVSNEKLDDIINSNIENYRNFIASCALKYNKENEENKKDVRLTNLMLLITTPNKEAILNFSDTNNKSIFNFEENESLKNKVRSNFNLFYLGEIFTTFYLTPKIKRSRIWELWFFYFIKIIWKKNSYSPIKEKNAREK